MDPPKSGTTLSPYTTLFRSSELIRERGWTRTLIERFLPRTDLTRENPHHPRGARMQLFDMNRVLRIEANSCMRAPRGWWGFSDRKSTRPNSSHDYESYAVLC